MSPTPASPGTRTRAQFSATLRSGHPSLRGLRAQSYWDEVFETGFGHTAASRSPAEPNLHHLHCSGRMQRRTGRRLERAAGQSSSSPGSRNAQDINELKQPSRGSLSIFPYPDSPSPGARELLWETLTGGRGNMELAPPCPLQACPPSPAPPGHPHHPRGGGLLEHPASSTPRRAWSQPSGSAGTSSRTPTTRS